jgi:light-regulated signal transduction histidine kinase (bacteriophytochrome)
MRITRMNTRIGRITRVERSDTVNPCALVDRRLPRSQTVSVDGIELEVVAARDRASGSTWGESSALHERLRRLQMELDLVRHDFDAFSYSIAHDLRAPIRAAEAFANMLQEDFGSQMPDEAQGLLADVSAAARKLEHLTQDLLQFSRVSRHPLALTLVDLNSLVAEAVEHLRGECQRDIQVRIGDLPAALGDESLLSIAFANLISNAFKFTSRTERPLIEIGCAEEHGLPVYFVRDNGAGFDMEYAARLFRMFQRLHREDQFPGNGAGLAIARCIVQRHGGRIRADAALNEGATFRFTLGGERS